MALFVSECEPCRTSYVRYVTADLWTLGRWNIMREIVDIAELQKFWVSLRIILLRAVLLVRWDFRWRGHPLNLLQRSNPTFEA